MRTLNRLLLLIVFTSGFIVLTAPGFGQTETATVSGRVTDSQGQVVPAVQVQLVNIDTNIALTTKTNSEGLYSIPNVRPGPYRILVVKDGFKEIVKTGLVLNVQDSVAENFSLQVGSVSESVTVTSDQLNINTSDASVSTVIDRGFVGQLPLNGRSFNTLLQLTPGAVVTNSGEGQFSINGQRSNSNYFSVDGVSANFGVGRGELGAGGNGQGGGGGLPAFNVFGGTSSLVSVDALQEFRVETSSFAPEYGRSPGGQVMLETRSGTNDFHGGVFDYFRNTAFDANNWFNGAAGLPRTPEHQNDFGGFVGGPVTMPGLFHGKDRTFFFFSYEELRLLQPQTSVIDVPSLAARGAAIPSAAPFLSAFPLPNGPVDSQNPDAAQFTGAFDNQIKSSATSAAMDSVSRTPFRWTRTLSRLGSPDKSRLNSRPPSGPITRCRGSY